MTIGAESGNRAESQPLHHRWSPVGRRSVDVGIGTQTDWLHELPPENLARVSELDLSRCHTGICSAAFPIVQRLRRSLDRNSTVQA